MNDPLLILLEGANDLEFLVRLTDQLRRERSDLPDLRQWQAVGRIVLVPVGGGDPASWPNRLRALGLREFHLYDREQLPETDARQRAVEEVNRRSHCQGRLTTKRALENYLHPQAIHRAGGGELDFGDHDPVSSLLARQWYEALPAFASWTSLKRRTHRRLAARAKRWLNTKAVEQMTAELLAERDPAGEVLSWLSAIDHLAPALAAATRSAC